VTAREDFEEAAALVQKQAGPMPQAATVRLLDEEDPQGAVVFEDRDGHMVMMMNRKDYDAWRFAK
jgi:hypothetical protein